MILRRFILALLLLAPCSSLLVSAQGNDEAVLWHELGVEKAITKNWDVGMDLEFRSQDKARFSAGLGTSYKVCKHLKFGVSYNFLYTHRPDKFKDKSEGEVGSDYWETGYNHTPSHWYPRHRFSAEATGSIKFWGWLKVSLRERYQFTHSRARTIDRLKHREIHEKKYEFDDEWNEITRYEEYVNDVTEPKYYPAYTDQVLRSRIKLEYDKKRFPFSPFIFAEAHNSVTVGDHMLLQKVRAAIGSSYKFRKHNEVTLSYVVTFNMYDIEDNEVVRQHDRRHAVCLGYKYSF